MSDSLCRWESHLIRAKKAKTAWEKELKQAKRNNNTTVIATAIEQIKEVNGVIDMAKAEIKAIKKEQRK